MDSLASLIEHLVVLAFLLLVVAGVEVLVRRTQLKKYVPEQTLQIVVAILIAYSLVATILSPLANELFNSL